LGFRESIFVRAGFAKDPIRKEVVWELLTSFARDGVTKDPENAQSWFALADIYREKGLMDLAREAAEKAVSLSR
jgi:cytochrome c-type biogenesis protein CcmH/NrfG